MPRGSSPGTSAGTAAAAQPRRTRYESIAASSPKKENCGSMWEAFAGDFLPPVIEEVAQGLLDGDARGPAGVVREAARIAEQERQIVRPQARRVGPDLDGRFRLPHQRLEQIADAEGFTAADVIGAAGLPFLHQQPVSAHGVADVGDVAPRVEVADFQHGLTKAGLRFDNLPREAGRGVGW